MAGQPGTDHAAEYSSERIFEMGIKYNNNDRLMAFDPGQPG